MRIFIFDCFEYSMPSSTVLESVKTNAQTEINWLTLHPIVSPYFFSNDNDCLKKKKAKKHPRIEKSFESKGSFIRGTHSHLVKSEKHVPDTGTATQYNGLQVGWLALPWNLSLKSRLQIGDEHSWDKITWKNIYIFLKPKNVLHSKKASNTGVHTRNPFAPCQVRKIRLRLQAAIEGFTWEIVPHISSPGWAWALISTHGKQNIYKKKIKKKRKTTSGRNNSSKARVHRRNPCAPCLVRKTWRAPSLKNYAKAFLRQKQTKIRSTLLIFGTKSVSVLKFPTHWAEPLRPIRQENNSRRATVSRHNNGWLMLRPVKRMRILIPGRPKAISMPPNFLSNDGKQTGGSCSRQHKPKSVETDQRHEFGAHRIAERRRVHAFQLWGGGNDIWGT